MTPAAANVFSSSPSSSSSLGVDRKLSPQHTCRSRAKSHAPAKKSAAAVKPSKRKSKSKASRPVAPFNNSGVAPAAGVGKKCNTPEFLLKLYRILQLEDNSVICWDQGQIHVRDPMSLGSHILAKYFRHSKYSSFQRQLNYFGFRKTQGKGKLSACTYTNPQLQGGDLRCLLSIKRKTSQGTADCREDASSPLSFCFDEDSLSEAESLPPGLQRQLSSSSTSSDASTTSTSPPPPQPPLYFDGALSGLSGLPTSMGSIGEQTAQAIAEMGFYFPPVEGNLGGGLSLGDLRVSTTMCPDYCFAESDCGQLSPFSDVDAEGFWQGFDSMVPLPATPAAQP